MDDADEDAPSWPPRDPAVLEKLRRGFPLRMDRQGNFFFEDDPVDHPGVVRLFRASLDATEGGEVTLGTRLTPDGPRQWVYLQLDDLPLRALRVDRPRDDETLPQLLLDDGRRLPLEPATLWEEPDAGLRCSVPARESGRALAVRLSNTAAMDLARWMVWDEHDPEARPSLEIDGTRWDIPEHSP